MLAFSVIFENSNKDFRIRIVIPFFSFQGSSDAITKIGNSFSLNLDFVGKVFHTGDKLNN